jgi:hypothetical protein
VSIVAGQSVGQGCCYDNAIEFRRRPWQRRIEVYSPKINRRLTLFSRDAHDAWLLLEADPKVRLFCERPAYIEGEAGRLIDFWVDRGRHAKFWIFGGVPRDIFIDHWAEMAQSLEDDPDQTALELLVEFQVRYPAQYSQRQLHTLQKRVRVWRQQAVQRLINEVSLNPYPHTKQTAGNILAEASGNKIT